MKLTRRNVLVSALPAALAAQTPVPQPATPVASPDYLAISAAQNKRNADALANVPVAIETEPAFHFQP